MSFSVRGTLPEIIRNDAGLYEGDLKVYFKAVFNDAQNLQKGYHNFRHMFHVVWLCYQAIIFYEEKINKRQARNLLIAAMFHDFDHPGVSGHDDLNIERAIRGFTKYMLPEDVNSAFDISYLIAATQYPYIANSGHLLNLSGQIIRDADMSQTFAMAWLQQIVFGLAEEWGKTPLEILRAQPGFLATVKFNTEWAKQMFPQSEIDAKIAEANEFIEILS